MTSRTLDDTAIFRKRPDFGSQRAGVRFLPAGYAARHAASSQLELMGHHRNARPSEFVGSESKGIDG
jgi:hypothetical protein